MDNEINVIGSPSKELSITVRGAPKSGKTRAILIITRALREHGFSVVVDDIDLTLGKPPAEPDVAEQFGTGRYAIIRAEQPPRRV